MVRILHWLEYDIPVASLTSGVPSCQTRISFVLIPSAQRPRYSGLRSRGVREAYYIYWYQHCNASRCPRCSPSFESLSFNCRTFLKAASCRIAPPHVVAHHAQIRWCLGQSDIKPHSHTCLMFSHFPLHRLSISISMSECINDCIYIETLHFYPSTYLIASIIFYVCISPHPFTDKTCSQNSCYLEKRLFVSQKTSTQACRLQADPPRLNMRWEWKIRSGSPKVNQFNQPSSSSLVHVLPLH